MYRLKRKSTLVVRLACIIVLIFACPKLNAKENNKLTEVESLNKVKLYLFVLGVEREQNLTRLSKLYIGASIKSVVSFSSLLT